jgi:hypothetical protein
MSNFKNLYFVYLTLDSNSPEDGGNSSAMVADAT